MIEPAYIRLHREGILAERAEAAWKIMADCRICPRNCRVDRTRDEIMGQYRPCARAREFPEIRRPVTAAEVDQAKEIARREGLTRQDECRPMRFAL